MNIRHVAMDEFVLLEAQWSVEQSRQLIERSQPSHVIVHHHNPRGRYILHRMIHPHTASSRDTYYLFSVQEALTLFAQASSMHSVQQALRLNERKATSTVEDHTDVERAPDQCIVLEEGRLIGFFDVTVPPRWTPRKGGDEIFLSGEPVSEVRSLIAEFPERVPVQTVFSLLVSLSASSTVATGAALPLALPLGTRVDIVVQPGRGFVLEGGSPRDAQRDAPGKRNGFRPFFAECALSAMERNFHETISKQTIEPKLASR